MKCPCCGHHSSKDILVSGRRIYFSDGTNVTLQLAVAEMFQTLLKHPIALPTPYTNSHPTMVAISKLRKIILELGLPYQIVTNKEHRQYKLVKDEQNNNPSKRS